MLPVTVRIWPWGKWLHQQTTLSEWSGWPMLDSAEVRELNARVDYLEVGGPSAPASQAKTVAE
ncbi:hypothetical protein N9L68_04355 [bacterium]|nr:hypothetical protein [bacterium]